MYIFFNGVTGFTGSNILRKPGLKNIKFTIFGDLNRTYNIMSNTIFIGVYPGLTKDMLAFVADRVFDYFK